MLCRIEEVSPFLLFSSLELSPRLDGVRVFERFLWFLRTFGLESGSISAARLFFFTVEGLSSQISCLENGMACNVDSQSLKLVGRFSCSASYFESGEVIESSPSDQTEDEDMVFLSHTPSEIIFFDPFAPGPNYLRNAPKKKMMKCSDACFQRQLNFDSGSDSEEVFDADKLDDLGEERSFLSSVFLSLLELIISAHLEEISADNQVADSDQIEDYKTPISSPLLTGIAETCPPAPQKPALTSKILDHSICRKLDFESCLTES